MPLHCAYSTRHCAKSVHSTHTATRGSNSVSSKRCLLVSGYMICHLCSRHRRCDIYQRQFGVVMLIVCRTQRGYSWKDVNKWHGVTCTFTQHVCTTYTLHHRHTLHHSTQLTNTNCSGTVASVFLVLFAHCKHSLDYITLELWSCMC